MTLDLDHVRVLLQRAKDYEAARDSLEAWVHDHPGCTDDQMDEHGGLDFDRALDAFHAALAYWPDIESGDPDDEAPIVVDIVGPLVELLDEVLLVRAG